MTKNNMLDNRERVNALIVNLINWDWDIFSKFEIDQETGEALVDEYQRLKALGKPDFDCVLRN